MDDFATGYMAGQDSGSGGGFGNFGEGIWAVIILAILFGRGGLGGFGGGSDGAGYQSAVSNGFALNGLESGIRGIQQGLCDGFYAVNTGMLTGFNGLQSLIASCCCDTQRSIDGIGRSIDGVNYNMANSICGLSNTIQSGFRDVIDASNNNYRSLMDFMVGEKLAAKDATIASLNNQISQLNQNAVIGAKIDAATAELLRRSGHECPTAAYIVNPPTPVNFGCGCGC